MKTWSQLLTRSGFLAEQNGSSKNVFIHESYENVKFLIDLLEKLEVDFTTDYLTFTFHSEPVSEQDWIEAYEQTARSRTEALFNWEDYRKVMLSKLDAYISGIVRHLNRLGIHTGMSCDGHGSRNPAIWLVRESDTERVENLLEAAGAQRLNVRGKRISFRIADRSRLLDIAENLSLVKQAWTALDSEFIRKQLFFHTIEQLLYINGASGNEGRVRRHVMEKLGQHVEHMTVDAAGNVLAQKTYRGGRGPVILLNAHLDTVEDFAPGREIIKDGSRWSSSEGILGADDRAGVAVVLELAKRLEQADFSGRVKFIFTVGEEIGLIGAQRVDEYFLWDVDAAIVIDRRNTRDIVTSCGSYMPFCHVSYGDFFRKTAMKNGFEGWQTVPGGSSDTRIWAEHGIQSVNLSAGYQNEHTDNEILNVDATYDTLQLTEAVFADSIELKRTLNKIKSETRKASRNSRLG